MKKISLLSSLLLLTSLHAVAAQHEIKKIAAQAEGTKNGSAMSAKTDLQLHAQMNQAIAQLGLAIKVLEKQIDLFVREARLYNEQFRLHAMLAKKSEPHRKATAALAAISQNKKK